MNTIVSLLLSLLLVMEGAVLTSIPSDKAVPEHDTPIAATESSESSVIESKVYQLPEAWRDADYVERTEWATGDFSTTDQGYFTLTTCEPSDLLVVLVNGPEFSFNQSLKTGENCFSLAAGDGQYTIKLCVHKEGQAFLVVQSWIVNVHIETHREFLVSSSLIDYSNAPQTTAKAQELLSGMETTAEKIQAVYEFVGTFDYDVDKAQENLLTTSYIPDLDKTLSEQSGICYDQAALAVGMLRSQGIPCKLVVGNILQVDTLHAWFSAYDEAAGVWIDRDPTNMIEVAVKSIKRVF